MKHFHFASVFIMQDDSCGIKYFDQRLCDALGLLGHKTSFYDLTKPINESADVFIFHYVPSLYARYTKEIATFFNQINSKIVSIIHGVYPTTPVDRRSDTLSPEIYAQIEIVKSKSNLVICLSDSATKAFQSWFETLDPYLTVTMYHPGLDKANIIFEKKEVQPYAFLGGVIRPKKNIFSKDIENLVYNLGIFEIRVWLHCSNSLMGHLIPPTSWRFTSGNITWENWSKMILGARWILCPYNTELQTVSGIIAEGISAGKIVLSTSFPYSIEMSQKFPELVIVENNFCKWPEILLKNRREGIPNNYPDMMDFATHFEWLIRNRIDP